MNPVGKVLWLSAALMLAAAAIVAVAVDPLWGLIVGLVAVTDGVLALLIGSGAIGLPSAAGQQPDPDGDGLGTLADGTAVREGENPLVDED